MKSLMKTIRYRLSIFKILDNLLRLNRDHLQSFLLSLHMINHHGELQKNYIILQIIFDMHNYSALKI